MRSSAKSKLVNAELIMKTLFIFGGDSRIGSAIKHYNRNNCDIRVLASTRRREIEHGEFHFELEALGHCQKITRLKIAVIVMSLIVPAPLKLCHYLMVTGGFKDGTETIFGRRCAEDFA